jgi:hypothetical protein
MGFARVKWMRLGTGKRVRPAILDFTHGGRVPLTGNARRAYRAYALFRRNCIYE